MYLSHIFSLLLPLEDAQFCVGNVWTLKKLRGPLDICIIPFLQTNVICYVDYILCKIMVI